MDQSDEDFGAVARAEIERVYADRELMTAWRQRGHPGRRRAQVIMDALHAEGYPLKPEVVAAFAEIGRRLDDPKNDPAHPQHREFMAELNALRDTVWPAGWGRSPAKAWQARTAAGDAGMTGHAPPAGFEERVFKLRQDIAALNKGDPRREPLMAEMEREYAAAYPEPAPAPAASGEGKGT